MLSKNRKKIIFFLTIFAVGGGIWAKYYYFSSPQEKFLTEKVKKGEIRQIVSVTGSVASDINTDLHFESGGKIKSINKEVGNSIKKGDIVAELEAEDEELQLQKARAALKSAEANLSLKKAGNRLEEIKVSETAYEAAKVSLSTARTSLENTKESGAEDIKQAELQVKKADISLESTLHTKEDAETSLQNITDTNNQAVDSAYENLKVTMEKSLLNFFSILDDIDQIVGVDKEDANDDFESSLGILKSTSLGEAQLAYSQARDEYDIIKNDFSSLNNEEKDLGHILDLAEKFDKGFVYLDNSLLKTRILLNNSTVSAYLSADQLSLFKSTIDADRITVNADKNTLQSKKQSLVSVDLTRKTNIDTAQANFDRATENYDKALTAKKIAEQTLDRTKIDTENAIKEAELNVEAKEKKLANAEASYNLKKAPPRLVDIASLQAQVEEARATLSLAEKNLEKTKLKSPLEGIITNIYKEEGENISIGEPLGTMISPQLIIEADVSEADIDKVKIDQKVDITFDAFPPEEHFEGKVFFIDPAETKIQDVIYYKIKVSLKDRKGKAVRSGMTANLEILTAQKNNVFYIPERSVLEEGGKKEVRLLIDGQPVKREIKLGLRGEGGVIEVISGLKEGDNVIVSSL